MSLEHLLTISVRTQTSSDAMTVLDRACEAVGLRAPDLGIRGTSRNINQPDVTELSVWFVSDDFDTMQQRLVAAISEQGLEVLGVALKSKTKDPHRTNADGVTFDEAMGTLTVETWGPDWGDLSLALLPTEGSIIALMASRVRGQRVEDSFPGLQRIIVRRPGGQESPVEGESPQS